MYSFSAGDFGFSDPYDSPPNQFSLLRIITLPTRGTLLLGGTVKTTAPFVVHPSNISALSFAPAPNEYAGPYATFTFQVQDDGSTVNGGADVDPSPNTITFNVQGVNDEPSGTDGTVTLLEDRAHTLSVADFGFTDPNDTLFAHGLDAVFITTLPTNGDLFLRDVRLTPPVPGPGVPVPFIGMAVVTSASIVGGELRFVPAANANGTLYSQFTFQVKDNGGTAGGGTDIDPTPNTITFNVTPVNDPPSFQPIIVPPVSDESGLISVATQTSVGPPDETGQKVMQFFVTGVSNPGLFSVPPHFDADGKLTFLPQPNVKGTAQITVGLKDDGGTANGGNDTSLPQTLTIEVFKARVMHNALKPLDVSGDGLMVAADALDVINFLNAFGPQPVPDDGRAEGPYYDCNGDGFVTASDALEVIDRLNAFGPDVVGEPSQGQAQDSLAEGESRPTENGQRLSLDELITLLGLDVALQSRRQQGLSKKH